MKRRLGVLAKLRWPFSAVTKVLGPMLYHHGSGSRRTILESKYSSWSSRLIANRTLWMEFEWLQLEISKIWYKYLVTKTWHCIPTSKSELQIYVWTQWHDFCFIYLILIFQFLNPDNWCVYIYFFFISALFSGPICALRSSLSSHDVALRFLPVAMHNLCLFRQLIYTNSSDFL